MWETFFIWMLHANHDERIMEGLRIKAAYSGIVINSEAKGSYETGKNGSWKTWRDSPNDSTKLGGNKGRSYTSTYTPGEYIKLTYQG